MNISSLTKIGTIRAFYQSIMDKRTPWIAKALPVLLVLYFVWPFDILPDVIPFAGYLDDLLIIPIGLWIAIRLIPNEVLMEHGKALVGEVQSLKRKFYLMVWTILGASIIIALLLGWLLYRTLF